MTHPWKAKTEIDERSFTSMSGSDIQPRSNGGGGGGGAAGAVPPYGARGAAGLQPSWMMAIPIAAPGERVYSLESKPTEATVTAGTAAVVQVSPMTVYVPATEEILRTEIERPQAKLAAIGQCPDCEPPKVSPVADAIARTRYPASMVEMALVRRPEFGG